MTMTKAEKAEFDQLKAELAEWQKLGATPEEISAEIDGYKKLIAEQVEEIEALNQIVDAMESESDYRRFELVKAQMACKQIPKPHASAHIQDILDIADIAIKMMSK